MPDKCQAHILSDAPASEDAFGSHKRLAEAIVSLISSGLGSKAIALAGGWGSGKSTVVRFIRDMLRDRPGDKRASVFVLDAWAHEGDPLRRTFIERLIDHLDNEGWVKKAAWETDLDRITRRREVTDTTSSPVLTLWGKAQILLILLVPLGYTLFSTITKDSYHVVLGIQLWLIGLFFVLLPVIFACAVTLSIRFSNWRHGRETDTDAVFAFFINKLQEVNTIKTIRTPDPTTIEFQDVFIRLLNTALGDKNRQLVVVVDNIDRVSAADALAIWSTMRTLFEFDGARTANWREQFWLVVPIDKSALDRLWNPDSKDTKDNGLVQAFIDKTFQIEFRISPPILSEWRSYFVNQLKLALPGHADENELLDVYRLYRQRAAANHGVVTPRDVKLFINNIVTLHLQWADNIPLKSQALFAICSDKIKNPQDNLTRPDFLDRRTLNLVGDYDWRTDLAALHYNIDPKNAIQVLIGRDVEEALSTGKSDGLLKFKDIPGFPDVIERIIESSHDEWAEKEPAALALSGRCLGKVAADIPPISGKIWEWLRAGAVKITAWKNLSADVGHGLVEILKHAPKEHQAATTKTVLSILSKLQTTDETLPNKIAAWLNALVPVVQHIHEVSGPKALAEFQVQCSAISYIETLALLVDAPITDDLRLLIKPASSPEAIISELAQICSKGQMRENHVKAISLLLKFPTKWPWAILAAALTARLSANNSLDKAELFSCTRALLLLAEKSEVEACKTALSNIFQTGHLFHHLAHFASDNTRSVAMSVIAILEVMPTMPGLRAQAGNSQQGINNVTSFLSSPEGQPAILDNFVTLCVELNKTQQLIKLGSTHANIQPLASSALKKIAKSPEYSKEFSPELIFAQREALRKLIGEELLAQRIGTHAGNDALISQVKQAAFDPKQSWFYLMLLNSNDKAYAPYLIDGLNKIPRDAWASELDTESAVIDLLLGFDSTTWHVNLGHDFSDALLVHARKVLAGQINPSRLKARWSALIDVLRTNSQREFLANLRDALLEKNDQKFSATIDLFGNVLKSGSILAEKADDVVRRLFTWFADRGNEAELAWLLTVVKDSPNVLKSCNTDYKTAFEDRVRDQVKSASISSAQSKETLKQIAQSLGIDLEAAPKPPDKPATPKS